MAKRTRRTAGTNGAGKPDDRGASASEIVTLSRTAERLGALDLGPEQLAALSRAPGADDEPWDTIISMMALDEMSALRDLAARTGLDADPEPRIDESAARFYERVPPAVARERLVAGLRTEDHRMVVATAQPLQPAVFAAVEARIGMPVRLVLAPRAAVVNLVNRGYEDRGDLVTEIVEEMPFDERAIESAAGSVQGATDLLALARQTPVIRLVNMILFEALRRRASDVHVHPSESKLTIRLRVDGILIDAFSPPLALASAIASRLKVMTELDIANRHSPQDGHSTVRVGSRRIDIRLSCLPTVYGERLVMRLLDQSQTQLSLSEIGMGEEQQGELVDLIQRPNGMILVTGPTGSGKTTTLYAALGTIDRTSRNVMTVEDPVEYHLEGISQTQVNVKRGVTFASGLRALLRQDPDVILVGEIRDVETANLAIQASLTGHLVLATLHTNDAPGAITRLKDVGVKPYLITSTLLAVLAQRLLRRVCPRCGGSGVLADGSQCPDCFGSGYRGRLAVYEIMRMDDTLRRMTIEGADAVTLREKAEEMGMRMMADDAHDKIERGLTDQAELYRVLHGSGA